MTSRMTENKLVRNTSLFLGVTLFTFGFLKLFDPFRTWFQTQIIKSDLPPLSMILGMAGEMVIGALFVLPFFVNGPLRVNRDKILTFASVSLIVIMSVATYVHLHPAVPADVLPLKIKPPFIPLFFLFSAVFNLSQVHRSKRSPLG